MENKKHLESLIQGIEAFISKNRCSLTNDDVALLNDCSNVLKDSMKAGTLSVETLGKVLGYLLKFLSVFNDLLELLNH